MIENFVNGRVDVLGVSEMHIRGRKEEWREKERREEGE